MPSSALSAAAQGSSLSHTLRPRAPLVRHVPVSDPNPGACAACGACGCGCRTGSDGDGDECIGIVVSIVFNVGGIGSNGCTVAGRYCRREACGRGRGRRRRRRRSSGTNRANEAVEKSLTIMILFSGWSLVSSVQERDAVPKLDLSRLGTVGLSLLFLALAAAAV
jgi:hypothetical protein